MHVCMLVYHFYLLAILFVFARIRHFTTRALPKYNGRFMCTFPWVYRYIDTYRANARRSHIPIPSSIYIFILSTRFCSFARSLSIIDLLELVRGKSSSLMPATGNRWVIYFKRMSRMEEV